MPDKTAPVEDPPARGNLSQRQGYFGCGLPLVLWSAKYATTPYAAARGGQYGPYTTIYNRFNAGPNAGAGKRICSSARSILVEHSSEFRPAYSFWSGPIAAVYGPSAGSDCRQRRNLAL